MLRSCAISILLITLLEKLCVLFLLGVISQVMMENYLLQEVRWSIILISNRVRRGHKIIQIIQLYHSISLPLFHNLIQHKESSRLVHKTQVPAPKENLNLCYFIIFCFIITKLRAFQFQIIIKLNFTMHIFQNLNVEELRKLGIGAAAILFVYCVSGIIHQYLIVIPYVNRITGDKQILVDKSILVCVPCAVTYVGGKIYNAFLQKKTQIPQKNSLICGSIVFISTITYTWAVAMTSYPICMAFKSCNLLSVLLVAILCSRVKENSLKLGAAKLLIGILITFGVLLFTFFDPELKDRSGSSQLLGIVLLLISLLSDGFLPDFQAQIKSLFKPQPTQMMQQVNKWVALISFASILLSFSANRVFIYMITHPLFVLHLLGMSILSMIGQFFVYYMIKQFKQHIVPFIITLRKIITILISIFFYHHKTSVLQVFGLVIVVVSVFYEFVSEAQSKSKVVRLQPIEKHDIVEETQKFFQNERQGNFR